MSTTAGKIRKNFLNSLEIGAKELRHLLQRKPSRVIGRAESFINPLQKKFVFVTRESATVQTEMILKKILQVAIQLYGKKVIHH